jgi:hypothetical protein
MRYSAASIATENEEAILIRHKTFSGGDVGIG